MLALKLIVPPGQWTLYAVCSGGEEGEQEDGLTREGPKCPLEEFLSDRSEFRKDKDRMFRRLEEIANRGPFYLPDISHKIEGEIRQTEQGRVRILWFFDSGRVIVCSHGFIKKSEKTPERQKVAARRAFAAYHAAKVAGSLIYLEE